MLRRFLYIVTILQQKQALSREYALLLWGDFRLPWFFKVPSTRGNDNHYRHLNSLEYCLCTTTMTNILSGRDPKPVPLGSEPQSTTKCHRDRPKWISKAIFRSTYNMYKSKSRSIKIICKFYIWIRYMCAPHKTTLVRGNQTVGHH